MDEIVSIAVSVAGTLTVQGVYFVLLKYPQQLSQEKLALETRQLEMQEENVDREDALALLGGAMEEMGRLSDGLCTGVAPNEAAALVMQLQMRRAQLQGLEIMEEPLASNVKKTIDAVGRGAELAKGWQGAPNPEGAVELGLLVRTLLFSAQAVKRANDRRLSAFWMQMRERQMALRSLFQTFVASAIALEVLSISFLGLGCELLTAHRLLPLWAAWVLWVACGVAVHVAIGRIMRLVMPVNALAESIEATSEAELKRLAPFMAQAAPAKQETPSA